MDDDSSPSKKQKTMDSSDAPPQIQTWSATPNRHVPPEIMAQILPNLPVQSLLRFSSASKSWNSLINEADFLKKYRGHERILIHCPYFREFLTFPLSAALSTLKTPTIENVIADHVCPISPCTILSLCQGLCCAAYMKDNSLFLWNPLLPNPQNPVLQIPHHESVSKKLQHELGYDSIGDDYIVLRISLYRDREVVLYSLRSNSWRKIQSFPEIKQYINYRSCCLNGVMHWVCKAMNDDYVIVYLDLSTEEFGEFALPPEYSPTVHINGYGQVMTPNEDMAEVSVWKGKLCLSLNFWEKKRFELWVMEKYGVVESWTKKFGFDCEGKEIYGLKPLDICDDGENLICVTMIKGESWVMLMNKDGEILLRKNFGRNAVHVYVESLESPAMFSRWCSSERSQ